jgi:cleavage and polyadenylation specificity factor subunit 1
MIFNPEETVLCMKLIDLEISEHSHERKSLIVVGTAKIQGEDYTCGGSIYVFDVVQVVPDPDKPEINKVLKLIAREELRGPVTALAECGEDGFLVHAQGQKIMVRGLKEDHSLLPVAFLDVQCLVTSLKNVKGTGLVLVADAMKGVWLTGYSVCLTVPSNESC